MKEIKLKYKNLKKYKDKVITNKLVENGDYSSVDKISYKNTLKEITLNRALNNDYLSALIEFAFQPNFVDNVIIEQFMMFFDSVNYINKLSILDLLLENIGAINKSKFIRFHEEKLLKRNFKIVKFQLCINLFYYNDEEYLEPILELLLQSKFPTLFYRALNSFTYTEFDKIKREKLMDSIKEILIIKHFEKRVNDELNSKIEFIFRGFSS